jgi:polyisoprenoid-binding protein YceI/rhodanese-related sulfurtransferase
MMKTILIDEVSAFDGALMDVRLADDFAAGHLPGAVNNCVFEVAFGERLSSMAPLREMRICVYGAGPDSKEAEMAADKLARAGYSDVVVFEEGIAAWKKQDRELEGDGDPPSIPQPSDGLHSIDVEESGLLWVGRNLLNRHWGTVAISHGALEIRDGNLAGGDFVIDMNAIDCSDLDDNSGRGMLIAHLRSDDFFDTVKYPQAKFVIGSAKRIEGAAAGEPNLHVEGELMLKDVVAPLSFDAVAGLTDDGKLAAQATLAFDRTIWNVIYGSGKMFRRLAGHLVNDMIELQVKIVAG